MAFLGDLLIRMRADTADFQSNMGKAQHVAEKSMRRISSLAGSLGIALGGIGMVAFIKQTLDAQDALSKMAQKTGITVESLAGLKHAGELAGVSFEGLAKGVKTISTQMFDASSGLAESKRNFAALNIEIKNTDGTMKSAETVMVEVADRFAAMADGSTKTALAVKLFGKAGMDMIPLLNQGSAALADAIAEGRKFNPVTAESAKQAEIFNDNIDRLSKTMKTTFISAINDVLPALAKITDNMVASAAIGETWIGIWREINRLVAAFLATAIPTDRMKAMADRAFSNLRPGEVSGGIGGLPPPKVIKPFNPRIIDEGIGGLKKAEAARQALLAAHQKGEDDSLKAFYDAQQDKHIAMGQFDLNRIEANKKMLEEQEEQNEQARIIRFDAEQALSVAIGQMDLQRIRADADKNKAVARELGMTFSSAFEDAIIKGLEFREVLRGIAQDVARIIARKMVTEPIGENISGLLKGVEWSKIFSGFGGAGSTAGMTAYSAMNFATGTDYVPKTGLYQLHQGEAVLTSAENSAGGTITFAPSIYIDSRTDSATIARTVDGAMRQSEARLVEQLNQASGPLYRAVRRA